MFYKMAFPNINIFTVIKTSNVKYGSETVHNFVTSRYAHCPGVSSYAISPAFSTFVRLKESSYLSEACVAFSVDCWKSVFRCLTGAWDAEHLKFLGYMLSWPWLLVEMALIHSFSSYNFLLISWVYVLRIVFDASSGPLDQIFSSMLLLPLVILCLHSARFYHNHPNLVIHSLG